MPLLTIVIPTYNRADCLSLLLTTLADELAGLEDKVRVIIGDNASTDNTPSVTAAFQNLYPSVQVLRHSRNLGPDENFCRCIDKVESRFFWIIGDDDLPKTSVLRQVVGLLEQGDPDILYLNSQWTKHIFNANDGTDVSRLTVKSLSQEAFAKQVNVWVTFISGMVVNLDRLYQLNPRLGIRRFIGTSLVQLGWILPLLKTGSRFQMVKQRCLLATGGNSGGYKLLTVFAKNFPDIMVSVLGKNSVIGDAIEHKLFWSYLPGLLWILRFGNASDFIEENVLESLIHLKKRLAYWVILLPITKLNKLFAMPFYVLSKILAR